MRSSWDERAGEKRFEALRSSGTLF